MVEASVAGRRSGAALVMVVWLLSGILVLCIIARLLPRCKPWSHRRPSVADDVLVIAVSVLAMASMFTIASTGGTLQQVDSVGSMDTQVKTYASTVLFVLATSLAKTPLFIWLRRLNLRKAYKAFTIAVSCMGFAYIVASVFSVVFQCKVPRPWNTQGGHCMSLQQFWTATIAIDIAFDLVLIVLPVLAVMSLAVPPHREMWAAVVLILRILLIVLSLTRLAYIQQATFVGGYNLTANLPYVIATQCQVALAAILACMLALPCLANLGALPLESAPLQHRKHWSGSSLSSFLSLGSATSKSTTLVQMPLPTIQASMTTPTSSSHGPMVSLCTPPIVKPTVAPCRPPRPLSLDTPDMSMFTHRPTVMSPPPVTLLGVSTVHKPGCRSKDPARTSEGVKFDV